ncbi:MAG: 50S ribosomal protein L6 [Gemmatimonadetes bacterium]|nr:50S ribosomal protein L6 [Gemmatimonadota bacterium]
MSRIGKTPVVLPQGVEVGIDPGQVRVKGPKGELKVPFNTTYLEVKVEDGSLQVARNSELKEARALHGLARSLIANAVAGVTEGFSKRLDLFGVGYRAEVQGRQLTLNIGYSHPVIYEAPQGIDVIVEGPQPGAQARIVVNGIDKQQVGQVAADIRFKRKPEPYKGKGIRYENEVIHWKTGKAAV